MFPFLYPGSVYNSSVDIEQTDVAPTLSLLLGVPTPQNSLGVLVHSTLDGRPPREQLQAAYINGQQVAAVLMENVQNIDNGEFTF